MTIFTYAHTHAYKHIVHIFVHKHLGMHIDYFYEIVRRSAQKSSLLGKIKASVQNAFAAKILYKITQYKQTTLFHNMK